MSFIQAAKRRLRASIPPCVFLLLAAYFCYGATQGDRGLGAWRQRSDSLSAAHAEEQAATADLQTWERRVDALRNNHLDADVLDERARAMLNLSAPGDIIVPLTGKNRTF